MPVKENKGQSPGIIDWDKWNVNVSESDKSTVREFVRNNTLARMQNVMVLGDSGKTGHFYLLYYAILFDEDQEVRLAALSQIHQFASHPDFNKLMKKIEELDQVNELEPHYSMMLKKIGKTSADDVNNRLVQE